VISDLARLVVDEMDVMDRDGYGESPSRRSNNATMSLNVAGSDGAAAAGVRTTARGVAGRTRWWSLFRN